jgi:HlyD family secretion protein
MDVPRGKSVTRNRRLRRILYIVIVLGVIAGGTVGLSRLQPAAPSVDAAGLYSGTVKRGDIPRNVRGLGTLVPEEIRFIQPVTSGRVERRNLQPGAVVTPETVLVELSNPDLEQTALEAESQLRAAEAELVNQKVQLESGLLTQEATVAGVQSDYNQAKLRADAFEKLVNEKVTSELDYQVLRVRATELAGRLELEKKRYNNSKDAIKSQLAVQEARINQLRTLYELRRSGPGTNIAQVADPKRLMARVRIQENQAKDVQIGQKAEIDARTGSIIPGHVIRIDPSSVQGTRTVDVALDAELPKGAVPDMNVDGTIMLELLENVLYVERPAFGQENSSVGLFKYTPDGKEAIYVTVKLGRSSVNTIEILEGLQIGDKVILSDMSQWDGQKRVRIN